MKLSVIIPVYNRAGLVEHAIRSVLAQSCPAHEVIVIDDGSTDDLASVIGTRFGAQVRFARQPNGGAGSARNRALDMAEGDWVAFLDSDDWWNEGRIASAVAALEARPSIEFMQANRLHVTSDDLIDQGLKAPLENLRTVASLIRDFTIKTSAVMIKRDLIERLALRFPTDQKTCEDYHFFWRAVIFAKEIEFTLAPDVMIRALPDSLSRVNPPIYLVKDNIKTLIEVRAWARAHDAPSQFVEGFSENLHWQFRNCFLMLMKSGSLIALSRYAGLSARHEGPWQVTSGLLSALKSIATQPRTVGR